MKKIKLIIITVAGSTLFSCGNTKQEQAEIADSTKTIAVQDSDNHEHIDEPLKLNGNEKWIISNQMKPYLTESEKILKTYLSEKNTDYKTLAKQLDKQRESLVSSCNMEGEAHDELHKWLVPYMELIDDLTSAETTEQAQFIVSEMNKSFQTFNTYFQ